MFDLLKANPYVLVSALAVCDVFGLLGLIVYIIKHTAKGKRCKKIVSAVLCFIAVDFLLSFFIVSSNTIYDRNGNRYYNADELKYYDNSGTAYTLITDNSLRSYFVADNGSQMYNASRIYIDEDGFIYYDRTNEVTQNTKYNFVDKAGNKYYRYQDITWNKNGQIQIKD